MSGFRSSVASVRLCGWGFGLVVLLLECSWLLGLLFARQVAVSFAFRHRELLRYVCGECCAEKGQYGWSGSVSSETLRQEYRFMIIGRE
jgi:hypothetical protein